MRIFIEGYDTKNWGDALMATTSALLASSARPDCEIVFPRPLPFKDGNRGQILKNISFHTAGFVPSFWDQKKPASYDISQAARRASSPEAILFCNGFIFGDCWHANWIASVARGIRRLNRRGAKVVLMPQSFGPFNDTRKAAFVRMAVDNSTLVFARDQQSFQYLQTLKARNENIQSLVDYTGLLNRHPAFAYSPRANNRIAIIPNVKIKDTMGEKVGRDYVRQLAEIGRRAKAVYGFDVKVVAHTNGKDRALADMIAGLCDAGEVIIGDPLEIRRFVGESRVVLTSRFHGLMNALSQNVPALSVGWSHKYDELMGTYGMAAYAVDIRAEGAALSAFDALLADQDAVCKMLEVANARVQSGPYQELQDRLAFVLDDRHR